MKSNKLERIVLRSATGTSSLKLRDSKLLGNGNNGLAMVLGDGNALDIGTGITDAGGNTFSVPTTGSRNTHAGLCLENTGGTGSQPAEGNKWAACSLTPPAVPETSISGNCTSLSAQVEIAYKKKSSGGDNPVAVTAATGCSVGAP